MVIRTVFDARPRAGRKYAIQTALLTASWRHFVKDRSAHPLEIFVIGEVPPGLAQVLTGWGARLERTEPHETDSVSRHANKLRALDRAGHGPILLVDNDTCFVADVPEIAPGPGIEVMAAVAGSPKLSAGHWQHIRERLGLRALDFAWRPLRDQVAAFREGHQPESRHDLYLNSGVVWVARPADFGPLWAQHIVRIAQAFAGHPLETAGVTEFLDQAGLATAVGTYGRFALLDDALNYRPRCFRMGMRQAHEIRIVHMTGMHLDRLGPRFTVEDAVRMFWNDHVRPGSGAAGDARRAVTESVFDRIREVIAACQLDHVRW